MTEFRSVDKIKFEKLFKMEDGYVLDFTNITFQNFILENISVDIYDDKYQYRSGSKANRLRGFWKVENIYNITKLNEALLEYLETKNLLRNYTFNENEKKLFDDCVKINERLKKGSIAEHVDAIQPTVDEKDFALLAKSIRESIEKN